MQIELIGNAAESEEAQLTQAAEARMLGQHAAQANAARRQRLSLTGSANTRGPIHTLRRAAAMN